jgi:LuxR family transcriptional regulator, maltose regulon positive regulatory protein
VARERLFALLDEAREHKPAICVVGPPGAGKTTLVASWLDARSLKGIWYQVDPGDADLATFFYYLGEAARPFTRKGRRPLPRLTPEYLHDIEGFSRRFFRGLFTRLPDGAAFVMDNYQEVSGEHQFHLLIAQAIDEVPAGKNLIVVSRRDPPDCYARLIANQDVVFLDWESLKLTLDEAAAIVTGRKQADAAIIRELHQRSDGWAAGLVLMLESVRSIDLHRYSTGRSMQKVFDYFAAQMFDRIPDETRQFLLATADLPWIDIELGELIGGAGSAKRILEDLCRRNLFTHRRAGEKPSYQYHALFREFLRARAGESSEQATRAGLWRSSAEYLERSGSVAEAFHLLREAQAWNVASELILRHAADLTSHGRFQTLADWISALPETVRQAEPWLAYWYGRALVPLDPASGRRMLEQAHAGFRRDAVVAGEVVSAAGIIDSIFIDNRYFVEMDPWIEVLNCRFKTFDDLPSQSMQLQVCSSGLIAMLYRQPDNRAISSYLAHIVSLLELEIDVNNRISAAISVLIYACVSGAFVTGHRVRALIDPLVSEEEVAPVHRFLWKCWLGYFLMLLGEYKEAGAQYLAAEEVNRDGQFPWSANLQYVKALYVLGTGDTQRALQCLDAVESVANHARPQDLGYLSVARAWKGMMTGDPLMAKRESEAAVAIAEQIGNFSLSVIWQTPMMWAMVYLRRREEFMDAMAITLRKVLDTCYRRPHVELLAMKTWLLLREGERDAARDTLDEVLKIAESLGHGALFDRVCRFAPELREFAGSVKANDEFLRALIRKFNWPTPSPVVESWPWPIKVYTLGRFAVLLEDKPPAFGRKVPRKPLLLLKAIIAFGEHGVSEQRLIDALWPDEEGDGARHALALALHRLRRLLGHPEAITVSDSVLGLNRDLVWADVRAFEALLEREDLGSAEFASSLLGLYRGSFLADEVDQPWAVSTRERLRARLLNAVDRAGAALEASGQVDEAMALYLRGMDADPLAETFYQGLMRCHLRQGRHAEAFSTYRRLRQTLSVVLGVQPSPGTEALVRGLRTY